MITLDRAGTYVLIETKRHTKILVLDNDEYAWVSAKGIGEILITTHKAHDTDYVLSTGDYRIYGVDDEPTLSDLPHLELEVGIGQWQGYLLLTGLPGEVKSKSRIVPTREKITGLHRYKRQNNTAVAFK